MAVRALMLKRRERWVRQRPYHNERIVKVPTDIRVIDFRRFSHRCKMLKKEKRERGRERERERERQREKAVSGR
jgi:hypothetical protein